MEAISILEKIEETKVLALSTVTRDKEPRVRFIDLFLYEGQKVYFFTLRGKDLFEQLLYDPSVEILFSHKNNVQVRLRGYVKRLRDTEREIYLNKMFNKHMHLQSLYPGHARDVGEIFVLSDMEIEYLNRSVFPITRHLYTIGNGPRSVKGYEVLDHCLGCGICVRQCPKKAIAAGKPARIIFEKCIDCGYCMECCPVDAIRRRTCLNE